MTKANQQRTLIATVLIALLLSITMVLSAAPGRPFAGKTKHKTVKRMTKRQVKKAQNGKTFYYRKNRKVVKR